MDEHPVSPMALASDEAEQYRALWLPLRKLVAEVLNLIGPAKVVGLIFNRRDDRQLSRYYRYHGNARPCGNRA